MADAKKGAGLLIALGGPPKLGGPSKPMPSDGEGGGMGEDTDSGREILDAVDTHDADALIKALRALIQIEIAKYEETEGDSDSGSDEG